MPFPKRLLRDDEELVVDLRPHPIAIVFHITVAVISIIVMILILNTIPDSWATWFRWAVFVAAIAVIGVISVPGIVGWLTSHFVLTSERVITRSGWVSKNQKDIPLDRVQNVAFSQSVFERMIGAGDLVLQSAGDESEARFEDVRHPEQVQKTIYVLREQDELRRKGAVPAPVADATAARAAPAPPPGPPGSPGPRGASASVADEIAKLNGLREQGIITDTEFQTQKAKLLGA